MRTIGRFALGRESLAQRRPAYHATAVLLEHETACRFAFPITFGMRSSCQPDPFQTAANEHAVAPSPIRHSWAPIGSD